MRDVKVDIIEINKFQSWIHALLELHGGLNVLSGLNHHGKSAIIRGANLVINNRPAGKGFLNDTVSNPQVDNTIQLTDGNFATRSVSLDGSTNCYTVSTSDDPLKAVKGSVPDEVRAAISIWPEKPAVRL